LPFDATGFRHLYPARTPKTNGDEPARPVAEWVISAQPANISNFERRNGLIRRPPMKPISKQRLDALRRQGFFPTDERKPEDGDN
jgi:hypothetical protein